MVVQIVKEAGPREVSIESRGRMEGVPINFAD